MSGSNSEMARIEAAWNELVELVNRVQDADGLTRTGADGWTVKDHLAHVAAWERSLLGLVDGRDRLVAMGLEDPIEENTDAINEAILKLHQSDTPDEALGYFRDSHAQLMAALGNLSEADLQKPYSHFQPSDPDEKRPVIGWVEGNTYQHYAEHIAWIRTSVTESLS